MSTKRSRPRSKTNQSGSSPTSSQTPDAPVVSGYLQKLSGKSLLTSGYWKRKYCVLGNKRLFYYDKEGEGVPSYINLEYLDTCEEVSSKEIKKASNVFVICASDKSFFDTGRYYFSADTLTEMNEWVGKVRTAMEGLKKKPAEANKRRSERAVKENESRKSANDKYSDQAIQELTAQIADHLPSVTKERAKGPQGRRLPRQRMTLMSPTSDSLKASASMTALESSSTLATSVPAFLNHSMDAEDMDDSMASNGSSKPLQLTYAYSSSEESLNTSFSSAKLLDTSIGSQARNLAVAAAGARSSIASSTSSNNRIYAKRAPHQPHRQVRFRPLPQPSSNSVVGNYPSAALQPHCTLSEMEASWTSSLPIRGRKSQLVMVEEPLTGSLSSIYMTCGVKDENLNITMTEDCTPQTDLPSVWKNLETETKTLKKALAHINFDAQNAQRDMGCLQGNLITVQSSANATNDKVTKLQSHVASVEKQVMTALKESQVLQEKLTEALSTVAEAKEDFRALQNECMLLLRDLKQAKATQTQARSSKQELDSSIITPLSPMATLATAFSPSSSTINSISKPTFTFNTIMTSSPNFARRDRPLSALNLIPPKTFDFASLLSSIPSTSISSSNTYCMTTSTSLPRMKSSLKTEGAASNKSISFGPVSTCTWPIYTSASNPSAVREEGNRNDTEDSDIRRQ